MKEENDSGKQIEQFKLWIKNKSLVHQSLLKYLGISAGEIYQLTKKEEKLDEIYRILIENSITTNKCEFREFLETISDLCEKHKLNKEIKYKVESLLKILKEDMKTLFSEREIYSACQNNFILLILVEQNVLSVGTIIKNIQYHDHYNWIIIRFFYPEIRKYDGKYFNELMMQINELKQFAEKNDQNLEYFYEIRKVGEKEPKIIDLIREDKIKEFITFVELSSIDINEKIQKEEIFDINIDFYTPIEYSALFGSISIFIYERS